MTDDVNTLRPRMMSVAYRMLGSVADAEDAVQDAFVRYQMAGGVSSPEGFLIRTTTRLCIDRLRALARAAPDETEPDEHAADDVLHSLVDAIAVRAALDAVGDPCREMLDRFFCRDESYRTIGAALDLPAGTIASRISRCLAKLRQVLEGKKPGDEPV